MIRRGGEKDLENIIGLTRACAETMISKGIYQWNAQYPNPEVFIKDFERQELYVLIIEDQLIGTIVLSTLMDVEYESIQWLTANTNNMYVHRLAIRPEYQGKGYAQQLMDYADNFAIDNAYSSIRLDTFSQNKRNQKFYELRGYKQLGDIYFPKQSKFPFYCYELVL